MAAEQIVAIVRNYLAVLPEYGVHAQRAVLFGSSVRGQGDEWSDIDLVVIAPEFDERRDLAFVKNLWRARLKSDERIEPIHCGVKEWDMDDTGRPIIEIAREQGEMIELVDKSTIP